MAKQPKGNVLDHQQQNLDPENPHQASPSSGRSSCCFALPGFFSVRCLIVVVLSCAILFSAIFCLFPWRRSVPHSQPDNTVQLNGKRLSTKKSLILLPDFRRILIDWFQNCLKPAATVQAYFKLSKPVSEVIPHKGELEDQIYWSIGVGNTKVTVLSLQQSGASHYTDVEFSIVPVSNDSSTIRNLLSSVRSSFIKLYAEMSTLNLATGIFGEPTSFEVLKFPGGITAYPSGSTPVSELVVIKLNFTLNSSISEIRDGKGQQLNGILRRQFSLDSPDRCYSQFTNEQGSTVSPPVIVQFSVVTTMNQQRLDHFADMFQASSAKNLGLNNSVFGEVKSMTFSTYLEHKTPHLSVVMAPTPSS
ncbi:hypothetical protein CARUB_v10011389mg [Capsella rubella]|uniref:DUF7036 domain-containing protein n=1 Tax=Capsella rubella TaxID=81985 RepID=R0GNC6_9BRAS|nr:hypothetical protein CARUB_v10011389mg [Capsella rubella]